MKALKCLLLLLSLYISVAAPIASAQYSCVRAQGPQIVQGSITGGDNLQAGRIVRDGKPSSCVGDNASLENGTFRRRDTHNFVNPYNETVCVRVEVDFTGCGGNQTQSVAYSAFDPLAPASNVIGDLGYSTINKGSYSFSVGPNASFAIGVNEVDPSTGCPLYTLKVSYLRNCRQSGTDITNDGRADLTVYRPSAVSTWYSMDSETDQPVIRSFGTVGDLTTGGNDYTGDGRSDLSLYRPSTATWYFGLDQESPGTSFAAVPWGVTGDRAVPGDFDSDGKNDVAVYRPSEGNFYVLRSSDGTLQTAQWGVSTDIPVSGDFDGDSITDFAIVRPTFSGTYWWVSKSNFNFGFHEVVHWGSPGDKFVPGDYDGDAISDMAVWRPSTGTFYVRGSSDLQMHAFKWGVDGDIPQPADYDGDRKQDFAVFRPSNGTWYVMNSATQTPRVVRWGLAGDQPMATAYRVQ